MRVRIAEVDAWRPHAASLRAHLSAEERARIGRMRFERDRVLLAVAYGLHREVLAAELGLPAREVPLYRDPAGRPRLVGDGAWTSLSHTNGWVAVALDLHAPVGVDVEPHTRAWAVEEVAGSVVHVSERRALAALGGASRRRALLAMWVRKEAVLKAAGVGLGVPMTSFAIDADGRACVPRIDLDWHVQDLRVEAPVAIAVATHGAKRVAWHVMQPSRRDDAVLAYTSRS